MCRLEVIITLTVLFAIVACKDNNSNINQKPDAIVDIVESEIPTTDEAKEGQRTIYAWVDKLRLRAEPNIRAEIVDDLKEGQALLYLEEKTEFTEKVSLRGKIYDEPWLRVKTLEGAEGWVYAGGVKFYKPKVDMSQTPYDNCLGLIKAQKLESAQKCFKRIQKEQLDKQKQYVSQTKDGILFTLLSGEQKALKNIQEGTIEISDDFPTYE